MFISSESIDQLVGIKTQKNQQCLKIQKLLIVIKIFLGEYNRKTASQKSAKKTRWVRTGGGVLISKDSAQTRAGVILVEIPAFRCIALCVQNTGEKI